MTLVRVQSSERFVQSAGGRFESESQGSEILGRTDWDLFSFVTLGTHCIASDPTTVRQVLFGHLEFFNPQTGENIFPVPLETGDVLFNLVREITLTFNCSEGAGSGSRRWFTTSDANWPYFSQLVPAVLGFGVNTPIAMYHIDNTTPDPGLGYLVARPN